jgi:hypothetical protein
MGILGAGASYATRALQIFPHEVALLLSLLFLANVINDFRFFSFKLSLHSLAHSPNLCFHNNLGVVYDSHTHVTHSPLLPISVSQVLYMTLNAVKADPQVID